MHLVRKEDLPFIGSSYNFVGADNADVAVSIFIVEAKPGRGAPLHTHTTTRSPSCRKAVHGSSLEMKFAIHHPATSSSSKQELRTAS